MSKQLGMELSKVLFREEPLLLECDLDASARAAVHVSNLLGCILATVIVKRGEKAYRDACRAVLENMNRSAISTAQKADDDACPFYRPEYCSLAKCRNSGVCERSAGGRDDGYR